MDGMGIRVEGGREGWKGREGVGVSTSLFLKGEQKAKISSFLSLQTRGHSPGHYNNYVKEWG